MKKVSICLLLLLLSFSTISCDLINGDEELLEGEYKNIVISNGIGRSVNAITNRYIETYSGAKSVFDDTKMSEFNILKTPIQTQSAESYYKNSLEKFAETSSLNISNKTNITTSKIFFTSSVSTGFDYTKNMNISGSSAEMYYTLQQNIVGNRVEIESYKDTEMLQDALSDDFLEDIEAVQDGTMMEEAFINLYGTHIIVAGYFGGRLSCYFHLISTDTSFSESDRVSIEATLSSEIGKIVRGETSTSISTEISNYYNTSNTQTHFSAEGIGGAIHSLGDLDSFSSNYENWASSFNENEDYSILIDIPQDGLIAIWDLFPDEYSDVADDVYQAFLDLADETYNAFLNDFLNVSANAGNTTDFAGGTGTVADPYLIATASQLRNIDDFLDDGAHFKLLNDINLRTDYSDWEPIGSFTSLDGEKPSDPFVGYFDGGSHTISYTSIVNPSNISNNIFYGLFGSIENGSITNLNVNANIKNNSVGAFTSAVYLVSLGGVVGYSINSTISHCQNTALASTDSINVTGLLRAYAGGIVGTMVGGEINNCDNYADVRLVELNGYSGLCYLFAGGILGVYKDTTLGSNFTNDGALSVIFLNNPFSGNMSTSGDIYALESGIAKFYN